MTVDGERRLRCVFDRDCFDFRSKPKCTQRCVASINLKLLEPKRPVLVS